MCIVEHLSTVQPVTLSSLSVEEQRSGLYITDTFKKLILTTFMDDEVFLDAEEEIAPRRSGRKRRSTAGNTPSATGKKPRPAKKMPVERSPGKDNRRSSQRPPTKGAEAAVGPDEMPDAFWSKLGGMLGGLKDRLRTDTQGVREQLGRAIGDLGGRVDKAEKRMDELVSEVNQIINKRLATNLEDSGTLGEVVPPTGCLLPLSKPTYAAALSSGPALVEVRKSPGSKARRIEMEYWEVRRALRLRPIPTGDPTVAVTNFMREHLRLDEDFLSCLGPITVRRVPAGPAAKVRGEAIVAFQSVETRDALRGAARNLAGKSSDFGIRVEVPNSLKSSMKSLQSVAYEIRQKFPQARTNVLFDDDALELVLDFCTMEGGSWRRMSADQAKKRKKKSAVTSVGKFSISEGELDDHLDAGVSETASDAPE